MKVGGLDVGRRFDKTTYLELNDKCIADIVQAGSIRFKEQAVFLYPRLRSCSVIIVDVTGVGQGLYEALEELRLNVLPATIVAGSKMKLGEGSLTIGKIFLSQLIATSLPELVIGEIPSEERKAFRRELANFHVVPGKTLKFEARTGHDDRVIALGLALAGVLVYDRWQQRRFEEEGGRPKSEAVH